MTSLGQAAQVGVGHQRPVRLLVQQPSVARRDDQQAAVGQPVDAHRKGREVNPGHHLGPALAVHGQDRLRAPVGQPQVVLVPAQRLTEGKTAEHTPDFGHGTLFLIGRTASVAAAVATPARDRA
jgi:hypothetical protein